MPNLLESLIKQISLDDTAQSSDNRAATASSSTEELQAEVVAEPYNIASRLNLAASYENLGYPDLAAGEAYRALLLGDEALNEDAEFHEEVIDASPHEDRTQYLDTSCRKA